MLKHLKVIAFLMLFPVTIAMAAEKQVESETKVISGMSIVGNNETPKSLYIVPWKSSYSKRNVDFSFSNLSEELKPVDKSDFIRELDLYRMGNSN